MSETGTIFQVCASRKKLLEKLKQRQGIVCARYILPQRKKKGALFPLSLVLQRLWFLDQQNPGMLVSEVSGTRAGKVSLTATACVLCALPLVLKRALADGHTCADLLSASARVAGARPELSTAGDAFAACAQSEAAIWPERKQAFAHLSVA